MQKAVNNSVRSPSLPTIRRTSATTPKARQVACATRRISTVPAPSTSTSRLRKADNSTSHTSVRITAARTVPASVSAVIR
jgi:hypothetical protein